MPQGKFWRDDKSRLKETRKRSQKKDHSKGGEKLNKNEAHSANHKKKNNQTKNSPIGGGNIGESRSMIHGPLQPAEGAGKRHDIRPKKGRRSNRKWGKTRVYRGRENRSWALPQVGGESETISKVRGQTIIVEPKEKKREQPQPPICRKNVRLKKEGADTTRFRSLGWGGVRVEKQPEGHMTGAT